MDLRYEKTNAREWQMGNTPVDYSSDSDNHDDHESDLYQKNSIGSISVAQHGAIQRPGLSTHFGTNVPTSGPVVTSSATTHRSQKPVRNRLGFNTDNPGRAAWRARKPHNDTVTLSAERHQLFLNQVNHLATSSKDDPFSLTLVLEGIGFHTGTYIRLPTSLQDRELLIWGHDHHVKQAKSALSDFFHRSRIIASRAPGGRSMPSVRPISERNQKFYEYKLQEEAQKQKFSQAPEEGMNFLVTGVYLWPLTELPPEDILGSSFEALDPLRMFHRCYFVYDHQMSVFKILSNVPSHVRNAITSLGNLLCEYGTRKAMAFEKYLVALPDPSLVTSSVRAVRVPWVERSNKTDLDRLPLFCGDKLTDVECLRWKEKCAMIEQSNMTLMCRALLLCLKRMRYYRGSIQMRAHIGTFSLRKYRWIPIYAKSIPLEDFIENMKFSSTKGSLSKFLPAHQESGSLLDRTRKAVHLFEPNDTTTMTLGEVAPTHVGIFTFKINPQEEFKLQVETVPLMGVENKYEVAQKMWTKQNRRDQPALQFYNIRLQGGATWKLHISIDDIINKSHLIPALTDFAYQIRVQDHVDNDLTLKASPNTSRKSIFNISQNEMLHSFVQKTAWRYRLMNYGAYQFEVAKYDTFDPRTQNLIATHWACTIHSDLWDQTFFENTSLRPGAVAGWNPSLETFFAQDIGGKEAGFVNFVDAARTIVDFINSNTSN